LKISKLQNSKKNAQNSQEQSPFHTKKKENEDPQNDKKKVEDPQTFSFFLNPPKFTK